MATPSAGTPRPGVRVGSTSEFSLFFHVRPGHENDLREAVEALQNSPGYRPGDYDLPIATTDASGRGSYRRDALPSTPSITTSMAKRNRSPASPATN